MKFQVTEQYLAHTFPQMNLNFGRLSAQLDLDLGHMQLLRDCFKEHAQCDELSCVILLYLVHTINQGSMCLNFQDQAFLQYIESLGLGSIFRNYHELNWDDITIADKSVVKFANECLYFSKYWQVERQLETALNDHIAQYSGPVFKSKYVNQAVNYVINDLTFEQVENKQILAVAVSLIQPFSIISGGPGTGKTTIMSSVLRGLLYLGYRAEDMVLAAPTGRAANRMTESLHDVLKNDIKTQSAKDRQLLETEAMTLHRLLGAKIHQGGFLYGAHNLLHCKVLVVDEVSMVDVFMMKQLLQAIPKYCRVVLLGDQFQLPSVETGAVLADLMPPLNNTNQISEQMKQKLTISLKDLNQSKEILGALNVTKLPAMLSDRVTILDVSKRNQADIAIISEMVKLGAIESIFNSNYWQKINLDCWQQTSAPGVYHIPAANSRKGWQQLYLNWINDHYFSNEIKFMSIIKQLLNFNDQDIGQYTELLNEVFKVIASNRILTLVNETTLGNQAINEKICEMMRVKFDVQGFGHVFHGSVVMISKNDRSLNVFNGDVGILLQSSNGQLRYVWPIKNSYQSLSIHVIPQFVSAYAMTVHKSQGSEFNHVLMPLPEDENHRLMTREIIYTGLTRAKRSVCLYGAQAAIKTAIRRKTTRHSGLQFWYNQSH